MSQSQPSHGLAKTPRTYFLKTDLCLGVRLSSPLVITCFVIPGASPLRSSFLISNSRKAFLASASSFSLLTALMRSSMPIDCSLCPGLRTFMGALGNYPRALIKIPEWSVYRAHGRGDFLEGM